MGLVWVSINTPASFGFILKKDSETIGHVVANLPGVFLDEIEHLCDVCIDASTLRIVRTRGSYSEIENVMRLKKIEVNREHRRQGYGTIMLRRVEEEGKKRGVICSIGYITGPYEFFKSQGYNHIPNLYQSYMYKALV